jgi:nucleoside-diphosphate-sugar epimerase
MPSSSQDSCLLVTGATGHIGRTLTAQLRASGTNILATDLADDENTVACDLRATRDVAKLFEIAPIRSVIHLAGILPGAFYEDPLRGADVNLTGSLNLLRESIKQKVKRFVFASSVSVYGLKRRPLRPSTEDSSAPDEPYGASKRAIELVGENLRQSGAIEFVALRIARVVGPGIKKTSSPWRAQMFEAASDRCISIPFARDADLALVHVEDVARMLITLAETPTFRHCVYNSPTEIWTAHQVKQLIERAKGIRVELGPSHAHGGAICDGSRFSQEFGFKLRGLEERLLQNCE